jgi:hypothetical protein
MCNAWGVEGVSFHLKELGLEVEVYGTHPFNGIKG